MAIRTLNVDEVCDRLQSATFPVIVMHCRPDGDTVGSSVALAKIFGKMGKKAICICSDVLPKRLNFLCDGYVSENYTITSSNTVITVDIASEEQLGALRQGVKPSLMMDHHASGKPFADNYIVDTASACGEIIYDIARTLVSRGAIDGIDESIASSLYAAISSDTGCFKYSNATPKTHRAAAKLIEAGAKSDEINHLLFDSKDIKQLRAEAIAFANMELLDNGKFAITTITHKQKLDESIESEYFESAIDIVRSVQGVEIAATIKENSKGEFKASIRSLGKNVAVIAEKFGGGGHIRASGCLIPASDMEEAKKKLIDAILL